MYHVKFNNVLKILNVYFFHDTNMSADVEILIDECKTCIFIGCDHCGQFPVIKFILHPGF